jgi:hypothetical protein
LWPARAPDGAVLLRCIMGGARDPALVDREPAALIELARDTLANVLGARGEPIATHLVKWPRAIAQYTVGHLGRVERAEALAAAQNAVLAGSSYRGVAVNSICADAARVVRSVAQILAAPLALLLVFSLLGCSGAEVNNKSSARRDGGADTPPVTVAGDAAAVPGDYETVSGEIEGAVEVTVSMKDPPAAWVTSPGANRCRRARRAPVVVDTHGGVLGAAVWLEGVKAGIAPPVTARQRIAYRGCALEPRVQSLRRPGAVLEIASGSEERVELALEKVEASPRGADKAGRTNGAAEPLARFPLAPVGRVFAVGLGAAGVYRIDGPEVDPAWAVVSRTPYLAVTNSRGKVRFKSVVDGRYQVRVWHPPGAGDEPLTATVEVEVADGKVAAVEVPLPASGR